MEAIDIKKKIKRSWGEVSLNDYFEIKNICADDSIDETEKNILVLSILADTEVEDIRDMKLTDISLIFRDLHWLNEFDFEKWTRFIDKKITVGDRTYVCACDFTKLSYGQFVDFNEYIKQKEDNADYAAKICSVFLVEKGKKYGDDDSVVDYLKNNLSITAYNSINFFILNNINTLLRVMTTYLQNKMRTKMTREQEQTILSQMETIRTFGYSL